MENKINKNNITNNEELENKIESFIMRIENKYNKNENYYININGKILYYLSELTIIYFNYKMTKDSKNNLFGKDILFGFEFVENKIPYIRALSNFTNPSLFDGRNLFFCLTNGYYSNYIFDKNNLEELDKVIETIIIGINKFIINLNDNKNIKVLILYGEYYINRIYLMNDFLMNQPILNFFRIFEFTNNNKNKELKYIIITNLFFLIFEPVKENKSLGKLIHIFYIKDVHFVIENNSKNKNDTKTNNYYFKINKDINNIIEIKFILTSGGYQGKKGSLKDGIETEFNDYLILKNIINEKQNEINFGDFLLVIKKSRNLYAVNETRDYSKKKFISQNRCSDYKKYIEYYEILYDYYKQKENIDKAKLKEIFSCLTFFCVELITFKDSDPKENLIYKSKLEKYSKYCMDY